MKLLDSLIPSCILHHGMASTTWDGGFSVLSCNNEESWFPQMKIGVSKSFYNIYADEPIEDFPWKAGFIETDVGFEKQIPTNDTNLELDFDANPNCKCFYFNGTC